MRDTGVLAASSRKIAADIADTKEQFTQALEHFVRQQELSNQQILNSTEQLQQSRSNQEEAIRERIKENERQLKRATLQFIATTIQQQYLLRNKLPALASPDYAGFMDKALVIGSVEHADLTGYLGYFETLASGVNGGILDLDTVERSIGSRVVLAWDLNKKWIETERQRRDAARLYEEIENLARKIRDRQTPYKKT